MSKSRSIVILGSLILVALLCVSWFLLLAPRLSTPSDLNARRVAAAAANQSTMAHIAALEQDKNNIDAKRAEADTLANRFPATAAESDLFRLIKEAAAKAGIPESHVTDLATGIPAVGATDGSVTLPPATTAGTTAAAGDPNAAPAAAAAPAPVGTPAATGAQLGTMTIDVTVNGSPAQITRFLHALESMDRAFLIHSVTLGAAEGGAGGTATINGDMYLLPTVADPLAALATSDTTTPTEATP